MKRIITLTALVLGLTGGIAAADRGRGGWDRGPSVRDHRDRDGWRDNSWRRDRWDRRDRVVRINRTRPAFRDGRWYFAGGTYRPYYRPVINVRYRDYYRRPALIVENYDPVPGYIWIQGNWNWNGYEWIWMPGHYDIDQNYQDDYYNSGYRNDGYDESGVYFNGSVGGSVRF